MKSNKKVLIIGAGIHGSFLAKYLIEKKIEVYLIEKNKEICLGSSNATITEQIEFSLSKI